MRDFELFKKYLESKFNKKIDKEKLMRIDQTKGIKIRQIMKSISRLPAEEKVEVFKKEIGDIFV